MPSLTVALAPHADIFKTGATHAIQLQAAPPKLLQPASFAPSSMVLEVLTVKTAVLTVQPHVKRRFIHTTLHRAPIHPPGSSTRPSSTPSTDPILLVEGGASPPALPSLALGNNKPAKSFTEMLMISALSKAVRASTWSRHLELACACLLAFDLCPCFGGGGGGGGGRDVSKRMDDTMLGLHTIVCTAPIGTCVLYLSTRALAA
jgi:hypothetical protein